MPNIRAKVAAQDAILEAIQTLAHETEAAGNKALADLIRAECDRLSKKYGAS